VSKRRRRRRGAAAIAVAGVVAFGALTAAFLASSSRTRTTRHHVMSSMNRGSAKQLAQARRLMTSGQAFSALKIFDAVLRKQPTNAEALAYRGWLLKVAGLTDQALTSLNQAVTADPTYPDARVFRGLLLYQDKHDPVAALADLRAFFAANPKGDLVPMVRQVLDEATRDAQVTP
jgi:tetratricopeptide (TPR) repeat protein